MSRSVIHGWFEFVRPIIKHQKYLLVISISLKMQINKSSSKHVIADKFREGENLLLHQLKHGREQWIVPCLSV